MSKMLIRRGCKLLEDHLQAEYPGTAQALLPFTGQHGRPHPVRRWWLTHSLSDDAASLPPLVRRRLLEPVEGQA